MNVVKLFREDLQDLALIFKCAFCPLDKNNPITQARLAKERRIAARVSSLMQDYRNSLIGGGHEEDEASEQCHFSREYLKRKAKVLEYDFHASHCDDSDYVEYYRSKLAEGIVEPIEFYYERVHHKMGFSTGFFVRSLFYGVTAIVCALSALLAAASAVEHLLR